MNVFRNSAEILYRYGKSVIGIIGTTIMESVEGIQWRKLTQRLLRHGYHLGGEIPGRGIVDKLKVKNHTKTAGQGCRHVS